LRTDDLAAEAACLTARGVKFTRELDLSEPGTQVALIEGTDGVSTELLERNKGHGNWAFGQSRHVLPDCPIARLPGCPTRKGDGQ
jgi:hypothetical protein